MTDQRIKLQTPASPRARVAAFLDAFREAPDDADIDIRIGQSAAGDPAVMVTISGGNHAFTAAEARWLARVMEEAMRAWPDDPEAATLPNIIMGLRLGADQADKGASATEKP